MSAEAKKEIELEIAHVLFLDIVGYSKLSVNEQHARVDELNGIVRLSEQFQKAEAANRILKIPTGDGMALVFYKSPEEPAQCAFEISRALKDNQRLQVRMGIHSGPVSGVVDVNERTNVAGAGINLAQRVMDCGDAGHVLLSHHVAEDLAEYERWRPFLHDIGTFEVKHGARVSVTNLYSDEVGNPNLPSKLQAVKKHHARIRWATVAIGLLVLAAVIAAFLFVLRRPMRSALTVAEKSVAVLPFENLSSDKENAFFADGIQDDLVTSLARIKDLKVVSRGSVASYRDLSGRRLRAIAQELGVGAVLEGSVRRTANRVLVNVQLTDATTERQIWSDRYDRTLQDSITLQGELAAEIATALAAKLSPEEKAQVEAKLTNNPDAYVVYLRGREFQMRPEVSRDNFVAAEQCYRHAVGLDARFALAHARLAEMLNGRHWKFDHQPALLAEARSHAEEALRLDPHCGQAHMVMADILANSGATQEAIKEEVASALRLLPNDGYLVMIAALFQTDMGWHAEAEATFQRAIEINPREPKVFYNYYTLLAKKRDVSKARWALDRSLELAPESVYFRLARASEEFRWTGEVARTKKFLAEIPAGKDPDGRVTAAHCTAAVYERNFPEALRLLAACPSERLPFLEGGFGRVVPKGFVEGMIHFWAGNKERAYTALDSTRWILEVEAKQNPGDLEAHFPVALAYAAMGWKDAMLAEIARAKDKPDELGMAALFAIADEPDAALRLLEQVPPAKRQDSYYELRLHPHWDPLRSDARFEKMLGSSPWKTAAVP
jgi:TolB-like protein/class 3 adenylate cyclase/Flp pilus assembly protein TadD